jgi:uncharacterized membrane protein
VIFPATWSPLIIVIACCFVGFLASRTMHAKAEADRRGELRERSVVQTPRARLFGGIDNAVVGLAYYPAVAVASFFFAVPLIRIATLVAAAAATAVSIYLIYSLFFVTKMKCSNCMIAHATNILIMYMLVELAAAT